jgi:hypothetical protein
MTLTPAEDGVFVEQAQESQVKMSAQYLQFVILILLRCKHVQMPRKEWLRRAADYLHYVCLHLLIEQASHEHNPSTFQLSNAAS